MNRSVTCAVCILLAVCAVSSFAAEPDTLTVVYTANTNGKLIACSCPHDPYGGLAERETLITALRDQYDAFLLLDAGKSLSLFGDFAGRAKTVTALMNLMGYDAVGVDAWELFYGVAGTAPMRETAQFPLLAATIADSTGGQPFAPFTDVANNGMTARVVSICDSSSIRQFGATRVNDFRLTDIDNAITNAIEAPGTPPFLVVLSTLPPERNIELIEAYPSIDLIIEANGNRKYDMPVMHPTGVIVNPGGRGQFVGMVTLVKTSSGAVTVDHHEFLPVLDIPASTVTAGIVEDYEQHIR